MKRITLSMMILVAVLFLTKSVSAQDIVVAKDGSGDYTTVQAAFNAVPNNSSSRTVIYIKNGSYYEVLTLASTKTNVTIIGESVDGVILYYDNYASKINPSTGTTYGTSGSSSCYINGSGFYAWNITFKNSAGAVGQALAIYINGDKAIFKNCKFLGWQDTMYGDRCRQYFVDCYIEGSTDFIFGPSTAWFENCDIYSKGGTALTAASTESYVTYGYVFNNCSVTGASGVSTYLGRTWRPYAATTFMNSYLSSCIRSEGWSDWGTSSNQATARYNEYNNSGTGASTSGRVSWSNVLSSSQAAYYTVTNVLKTTYSSSPVTDNWSPYTVINNTSAISSSSTTNSTISGTYSILAYHSGKALDCYAWGTTNGTNICQWSYWGGNCQKFVITPVDGIWHRITPYISSGQAIDVYGCSADAGANINTWSYWGGYCQQFRFQVAGSDRWRIINRNSEKCFDVDGAGTADGTNVLQWNCTSGSTWQMFTLTKHSSSVELSGVEDVTSEAVYAYPNPAKDILNISLNGSLTKAELTIYDIAGKQVLVTSLNDTENEVNISSLTSGLYLAQLINGNQVFTSKFIKE